MLTKVCSKCKNEKLVVFFNKHKSKKDGLSLWCKECKRESDKKYYINNKESLLAYQEKHRHENKETIKKAKKEYRNNNKEEIKVRNKKYNQINKAKVRVVRQLYYKSNKDLYYSLGAKRRANKLRATPSWAYHEAILCVYKLARKIMQHVDHIVPLQSDTVCGLHWEGNLQILSAADNLSKGNRHWPDMW